jgi:hypothetical protein
MNKLNKFGAAMNLNCLGLAISGLKCSIRKIIYMVVFLAICITPVLSHSAVNLKYKPQKDNNATLSPQDSKDLAYHSEIKTYSEKPAPYRNRQPIGSTQTANVPTNNTVVVYLMGLAGTGKYTIAKRISQRGYKIVDNHLLNNPIFSLLGPDAARQATVEATEKIGRIRNIVLEFMVEDNRANYVLTNQLLQNEYHDTIYHKILNAAEKRGSIFVPVLLVISSQERSKRLGQPERARRFKITDPREAFKSPKMLKVTHENLLELNVSDLSAEQAAEKIMQHVERTKVNH